MNKPSTCHPKKPRLFSDRNAEPWELGLCAACRAAANRKRPGILNRMAKRERATRIAIRDDERKIERQLIRGRVALREQRGLRPLTKEELNTGKMV